MDAKSVAWNARVCLKVATYGNKTVSPSVIFFKQSREPTTFLCDIIVPVVQY